MRVRVLEGLGMSRSAVYRRCLPGGPWRRLLPGIVKLDNAKLTARQKLEAALLRGGSRSLVSGLWALRCHGLKRTPEPDEVHVLVPAVREITSAGFVLVERTTRLPAPVRCDGLPLAPVHRALLDAARRIEDFDAIRGMLAEAVQRDRCALDVLHRELEEGSQRGSALPRRVLAELDGGARSVAELDASRLWKRTGLPSCDWNVAVHDASGAHIATPDAWCDDVAFAWEIDSKEFHFDVDGYARTLSRNARYAAAGIVVLTTLPARLRREPGAVIRELRAAYGAARNRPRPPVYVR